MLDRIESRNLRPVQLVLTGVLVILIGLLACPAA
jgi:hypothetical protein